MRRKQRNKSWLPGPRCEICGNGGLPLTELGRETLKQPRHDFEYVPVSLIVCQQCYAVGEALRRVAARAKPNAN